MTARKTARRRLVYRAVGGFGEPYPKWLRALERASGVYVIRRRSDGVVLYVGESHTGNLCDTVTRHLSAWRRAKDWWRGGYGQNDPGTAYGRATVEVAAWATKTGGAAVREQDRLIRALQPRDNVVGKTDEDPPF